jgi:hypothetical protein
MALILLEFSASLEKLLCTKVNMNLETILSDTYYLQIHKLTTIEYHNTIITKWQQTLKCPDQDLSLSQLIGIYPRVTCHTV